MFHLVTLAGNWVFWSGLLFGTLFFYFAVFTRIKIKTMLVFGHLRQNQFLKDFTVSNGPKFEVYWFLVICVEISDSHWVSLCWIFYGMVLHSEAWNTKAFPLMAEHTRLSFSLTTQVHLPPRAFNAEIEGSLHVNHSFCPIKSHYQMCCKPLLIIYRTISEHVPKN